MKASNKILPSDRTFYLLIVVAALLTSLLPIIDSDVKGEIWFGNKAYYEGLYENFPAHVIYFALFFLAMFLVIMVLKILILAIHWIIKQFAASGI